MVGTSAASVLPQYTAAVVVNLMSFCNGLVLGWPCIVLPLLQSPDSPLSGTPLTEEEASWTVSSVCLATIPAIPVFTLICDRFGRKFSGYVTGLSYVVSWTMILVSSTKVWVFISRAIIGICCAGNVIVCPLYVSEIAQDHIRGKLGVFLVIFFNLGILFAYVIGAVVSYQTFNAIGLVFSIVFLAVFFFMPETPFYLLSRGKLEDAARSLKWLRGKTNDVTEELTRLQTTLGDSSVETAVPLRQLLAQRSTVRGMVIGMVLCVNQQMCGIFVILSYTVTIFTEAGGAVSPNTATIIVGVLQLAGSYLASLLVDRRGRKVLLISSNVIMAGCHFALGLYFYLQYLAIDVSSIAWLPVASLSVYMVSAAMGVVPLVFVIMTEIFLPQVQRLASTLGFCVVWALAFVVSKFFTSLSNVFGIYGCYWIFCISCILAALFTIFVIPETKGRSLESILDQLDGTKVASGSKPKGDYAYSPAATEGL